jgi:hypothetical protein
LLTTFAWPPSRNMQTYKVKLEVITDTHGQVLGTKQVIEDSRPHGDTVVHSRLIAGPGQIKHEVDVQLPESVIHSRNVDEIHKIVQAKLKSLKAR